MEQPKKLGRDCPSKMMEEIGFCSSSEGMEGPSAEYCSQMESPNEKPERGEERRDLFALTSKLSGLGEKAHELEQVFRSESLGSLEQDLQGAKVSLDSVLSEIIYTSASILSQLPKEEEIITVKEGDILEELVHFCEVCGKGFRRGGNVRIHMRSHGEQYKTHEALKSKRPKRVAGESYFACPVEDCRRNGGHPNFKPLKSMVCLRNHYRRRHCPKMYTCNRCGKDFSFLTDLKTHGKRCGRSSWRCSCNATFSTKNKLVRHVAALSREGHHQYVAPTTTTTTTNTTKTTTSKGESLDAPVQDLAPICLSTLAHGCAGDQDRLMQDSEDAGAQQTQFPFLDEYREENDLYGSLFSFDGDLSWT